MANKKKKFILKAERARLLQAIEQGDIIERVAQPVTVRPTPPRLRWASPTSPKATRGFGEPMPPRLETQDTETTARELRRIFATAIVLIVLLGCLTVIQIKTPYINQLAEKIGTVLSI